METDNKCDERNGETNAIVKYGKQLESLGRKFQNPNTKLEELVRDCHKLGLVLAFSVVPDPENSIELEL